MTRLDSVEYLTQSVRNVCKTFKMSVLDKNKCSE